MFGVLLFGYTLFGKFLKVYKMFFARETVLRDYWTSTSKYQAELICRCRLVITMKHLMLIVDVYGVKVN